MQSILLRILLVVLGVAIQAGTLYALFTAHQDLGATKAQVQSLNVRLAEAEGRLGTIQANVDAVLARSNNLNREVQRALAEHAEWASTPVPADIGAGLCDFANCDKNRTPPVQSSGD